MKAIKLFSMAVAALMMAACSNEDNDVQQPAQQARMIPFSATIGPAGGSTRTTITEGTGSDAGKLMVAWKGGETIALVHNGTKDVVTVGTPNPDGSAPISGTITVGTDGEDVVLVYPADAVKSVASGTTFVPNTDDAFLAIGFQQDGTLTYIGNNLDAREGSGTLKISGGTATLNNNVTMESKIAVWKLTLTTDGTTPLAANQVTLSIGTNPIAATAVNATGKSEWTLCVVPATLALYSGDFTISAKVGTDTYTYTKAGGVSLTKNTYNQSTVTMAKQLTYPIALSAVTSDYIGSVVTTDGNVYPAKTAVPAGKTAVGILGKVTATGQGLILALADATSQSWNTINGWTSVTTYAGTTLKQLPDDAARGSLTSYTTLGSGSIAVSNWCVAQKSDYEAIFTNLGSTTGDSDGITYDDKVNAYITTGVGGTPISGSGPYWSATERVSSGGWAFSSLYWNGGSKGTGYSLRPVLGF